MAHAAVSWVITGVVYPKEVKPPARWLLVHIAERADRESWSCFPSHKTLAKDSGMSPRTVLDLLFVLEQAQLIIRTQQFRANGERSTDLITLNASGAIVAEGAPCSFGPDQPQHSTPGSAKAAAQNLVTEPGKGTDVVLRASDPFEDWWSVYPRKVAKVAARKAWAKVGAALAKQGLTLADLMERTRSFAAAVVDKDPEHIAHPATWLNGERWNDELQPTRSHTDGHQAPGRFDRGADQHSSRVQAMVAGAGEALNRRRRWSVGG